MRHVLISLFFVVLISFYFFPIGFTFLPSGINTKNLLGLVGVLIFILDKVRTKNLRIPKQFLGAFCYALLFSFICFVSIDINNTNDYTYVTYIVSFLVWFFAAFVVCATIKWYYGEVDFSRLTLFLAIVCASQCVIALVLNGNQEVKEFVDRYVQQDQIFLNEVERLYGIGASLDNAGVRFSIVLIMVGYTLGFNKEFVNKKLVVITFILCFFIIATIGNMMSRTTTIGVGLSLVCFIFGIMKNKRDKSKKEILSIFGFFFVLFLIIGTYLYNTDAEFYNLIRYGFEGFFNWFEDGEWRTGSTDKLNRTMWIWPKDNHTWIIGSGLFDNWIYGTDIGYCRFILYCGLIGFSVFAVNFIYHPYIFFCTFPQYKVLMLCLGVLSFLIWIKVSTDTFQGYALFYAALFLTEKD